MTTKTMSTDRLRQHVRALGIKWPGEEYGHGDYVFFPETFNVVRLVNRLDEPGFYLTDGGNLYVEKQTARGLVQEIRLQKSQAPDDRVKTLSDLVADQIALYIRKNREFPTVLHVSYDDLVYLGRERGQIAQNGDAWGMSIVLEARGQKISVDRRIVL